MENSPQISQLQEEIHHNFSDVKAESLLAIAIEKGFSDDDVMIASESLFRRSYSRDIMFSTIEEDANKKDFLQLHLSRSGLHDQLPEGLFYQPEKIRSRDVNAGIMAEDHKKNKQKEQETRRFFMPFENAFFGQRVQLELEETQLQKGLNSGILNGYFIEFWGIPPSIPPSLITPLITLLPHAHRLAGNLALTNQCLEIILKEEIRSRITQAPDTGVDSDYLYELGRAQLGRNMVMGEHFEEDFPRVEFTIGPLKNSQIQDYLEGGNKEEFLNTFFGFFMPAEADVITRIEVSKEKQHMILGGEEEPVLGYSSVLAG